MSTQKNNRRHEDLPLGAPARRVRIDFGPAPIRGSGPPCRIMGTQPKPSRGYLLDN
jgi:hypothetical protein